MKKHGKISFAPAWFLCVGLFMVGVSLPLSAQRKTAEKKATGPGAMIKESSVDYQLWEGFLLIRKANAGEPAAQHELAIRYLQGKGFEADTLKALSWMQKAAEQGFDLASYNLGIFTMNGWGTAWNPFDSYRHFQKAATKAMPEAQFVLGLILTENLVVAQNWAEAYALIKKAALQDFEPAKKALVEFRRRGISDSSRTTDRTSADSAARPIFLDFHVDTTSQIDEKFLLHELAREAGPELKKALGVTDNAESAVIKDATAFAMIERAARAGSPEALTLLGRLFEKGIGVPLDPIEASTYYVRAMRLESGRARELLWNLVQEPEYLENLEHASKAHDPRAQFVWAGIVAARFDQRLSGEQALALLQLSSNQNYVDAVIEMGLCYQSGRWTKQDRARAKELWRTAAAMGSREASVRLAALKLFDPEATDDLRPVIRFLLAEVQDGSLLAQVALAYSYEAGRGVAQSRTEAARLYRNAAQRGSTSSYDALRRMHDAIRPPGKEFEIP